MIAARSAAIARKAIRGLDRETRAALVAALRGPEESLGALATRLNQPMATLLALAEVEGIPLGRIGTRAKWDWPGRVAPPPVETLSGLAKLIVHETPRPVTPRFAGPLWPRGADEEALCIG